MILENLEGSIFVEHWTVEILLVYDEDIILLLHGSLHYNARQFITLLKHSWEQKLVVKGLNPRNPLTPPPHSLQAKCPI